jgi:hypothetical protein
MENDELQDEISKAVEAGDPEAVEKLQSSPEGREATLARAKRDFRERLDDGKPMSPAQVLHHLYLVVHQMGNEFTVLRAERNAMRGRIEKLESRVGEIRLRGMEYVGVWKESDTPYRPAEICTDRGTLWYCREVTHDRPGTSGGWQLMVKNKNG